MPQFERWEEKLIGRTPRFENTNYELIKNRIYKAGKYALNLGIDFVVKKGKALSNGAFFIYKKQMIMGKEFGHNDNFIKRKIKKKAVKMTGENLDKGVAFVNRKFYYHTGKDAADALFTGKFTFNEDKSISMYNTYGYAPDPKACLSIMYENAAPVGKDFTDIYWRQEITPFIIRETYRIELKKCFDSITNMYTEHPGLYNRQLMEETMKKAAIQLGELFYDLSLQMANQTEYIEAPLTFYPEKERELPKDLTEEEEALYSQLDQKSLWDSNTELDKMISTAMEKVPEITADKAMESFVTMMNKDMENNEEPQRESRLLMNTVLTVRELKRKSENRSFFRRHFSREGRKEKRTIAFLKASLLNTSAKKLGIEHLDQLLDLKVPLEQGVAVSEVMGIAPKEKEKPVSTMEQVKKEYVEPIVNTTAQVIKNVAEPVVNVVNNAVEYVADKASNAIMGEDFAKDFQLDFDDDDLEIFGGGPVHKPSNDNEQKEKEATVDYTKLMKDELVQRRLKIAEQVKDKNYFRENGVDGNPGAYSFSKVLKVQSELIVYKTLEESLNGKTLSKDEYEKMKLSLTEEPLEKERQKVEKDLEKRMTHGPKETAKVCKDMLDDPDAKSMDKLYKDYLAKKAAHIAVQEKKAKVTSSNKEAAKEGPAVLG